MTDKCLFDDSRFFVFSLQQHPTLRATSPTYRSNIYERVAEYSEQPANVSPSVHISAKGRSYGEKGPDLPGP
jgi:hypothetical protein